MKKCPACGHVSTDEDVYCPNDGSILEADNSPSPFDTPTQYVPLPKASPEPTRSPMIFIAIGAMGATIVSLIAVLYMMSGSTTKSAAETNATNANASSPANAIGATPVVGTTVNVSTPVTTSVAGPVEARPPELPNYAPGEGVATPAAGATWFIVLGSYPHHEDLKAEERLSFVQGRGVSATKVDTGNYPGFRKGYYSVVVGPFGKSEARRLLPGMKLIVNDAYIRSGW